jgi:hypothetical protein
MKELALFDGTSYLLTDEEAKAVMAEMMKGQKGCIVLRRLELVVNTSSIARCGLPETIAYFWGMRMNDSKTKVLRNGEWCAFSGGAEYVKQIEYRLKADPSIVVEQKDNQLKTT